MTDNEMLEIICSRVACNYQGSRVFGEMLQDIRYLLSLLAAPPQQDQDSGDEEKNTSGEASRSLLPTQEGDLLPCPFCGATGITLVTDDGLHWNRCGKCGATGPETTKYDGEEGDTYTDWNTRAGSPLPANEGTVKLPEIGQASLKCTCGSQYGEHESQCAKWLAAPPQETRCGECDQVIEGSHFCFICIQVLKERQDKEEWQPINTAPKMKKLLGGYFNPLGKWRTILCCYWNEGTLESDTDDSGFAPEGWYEATEAYEYLMPCEQEPTHWMSLPVTPLSTTEEMKTIIKEKAE